MTEEQILLSEIEAFLSRSGESALMAESTFGRKAVNDGKLVRRLRDGNTITFEKARQIRLFIAQQSSGSVEKDAPSEAAA